jgi:hypothetical protein
MAGAPPSPIRTRLALLSPQSPFIDSIIHSLGEAAALLDPGSSKACMTSPEAICELVEVAYWASLQSEEGRPVRGTLTVVDPERLNTPICLTAPIPLSLSAAVEMLTASGGRDLGVHLSSDGRVVIWGFADVRSMFQASIRIVAPGTVAVWADNHAIGLIEHGDTLAPVSAGVMDLETLVARALGKSEPFVERLRHGAMFTAIARSMLQHGHGGMLVMVPSQRSSWEALIQIKHEIHSTRGAGVLNERLAALQDCSERLDDQVKKSRATGNGQVGELALLLQGSRDAHERLLRDGLDWVGQLTAIDGAVVLTMDMELLGFGAKLRTTNAEMAVSTFDMLAPSVDQPTMSVSALGGMRHQSAARFVNDCHDALVFVASQDGRLTLMAWVESPPHVAALTSLQHFAWMKRI